MIVLQHLTGPAAGQEVRSRLAEIRLGRDASNEVVLHGPKVSKVHARIRFQNQWYELVDENSLNGTWLNDEQTRLEGPRRLREHDIIRLGGPDGPSLEVHFEYDRRRVVAAPSASSSPIPTAWLVVFAVMTAATVVVIGVLVYVLRS